MSASNIQLNERPTPEAPEGSEAEAVGAHANAGSNAITSIYTHNPDATLKGDAKYRYVSGMFSRISHSYDLMNTLMSFGQDARWRRYVARVARPRPGSLALDAATGTGLIAQELSKRGARAVGVDFCADMMLEGMSRGVGRDESVYFAGADILRLPFADGSFSCVTTGFAMRNVIDIEAAFRELHRVVEPGGSIVCLEVGRPRFALTRALHALYTGKIVPLMGKLIVGDADAYNYLPSSMRRFPPPDELASIMRSAGLRDIRYKQLSFGAVAVHVGVKMRNA